MLRQSALSAERGRWHVWPCSTILTVSTYSNGPRYEISSAHSQECLAQPPAHDTYDPQHQHVVIPDQHTAHGSRGVGKSTVDGGFRDEGAHAASDVSGEHNADCLS